MGSDASDIELEVADGIVTMTGQVAGDKLASSLVGRVQKVPGVEDVAAMLRVVNNEPAG